MVLEWAWGLWDEELEEAFQRARGAKAGGGSLVGSGGGEAWGSEGRVVWGLALGLDISSSLMSSSSDYPTVHERWQGCRGRAIPESFPVLGREGKENDRTEQESIHKAKEWT